MPALLILALMGCSDPPPPTNEPADASGSPEVCDDAADNDLDGLVDCSDPECSGRCAEECTAPGDEDGNGLADCKDPTCEATCDGDGDGSTAEALGGDDCDDTNPNAYPGAVEVCDPAADVDEDCDGLADCAELDCLGACDLDGDGFVAEALGGDDCDDTNPVVSPAAPEVCDALGVDEDCDGLTEDADPTVAPASLSSWHEDADSDTYGNVGARTWACAAPSGYVADATDCDDTDASVHPVATEVCSEGVDEDCDGLIDDDDPGLDVTTGSTFYADADEDGFGDAASPVLACAAAAGRVADDQDCDDTDPSMGAPQLWLLDADGDGYGAGSPTAPSCDPPDAYHVPAAASEDCDDTDPLVHPDAPEVCDQIRDDDCDALQDADDPDCGAGVHYYVDSVTGVDPAAGSCTGSTRVNDPGSPFATLQGAYDCLVENHVGTTVGLGPVEIIVVDEGPHGGTLTISGLSNTSADPLHVRGDPSSPVRPLLDGAGAVSAAILVNGVDNVVIDHLRITGMNESVDYGAAISLTDAHAIEIRGCEIFETGDFGIALGWNSVVGGGMASDDVWIHHNVIRDIRAVGSDPDNRGDCVHIMFGSSNWIVEHNTFDGCEQSAVHTMSGDAAETNGTATGNILVSQHGSCSLLRMHDDVTGGQLGLVSDYNLFHLAGGGSVGTWDGFARTSLADWVTASGMDVDSLTGDPLFAPTVGDYHLQSTAGRWDPVAETWVVDAFDSPGIDAASPDASFLLEPAPNGARANLGAHGNTPEASLSP